MRGDARKRTADPTAASSIDAALLRAQSLLDTPSDEWGRDSDRLTWVLDARAALRALSIALRDEQQAREAERGRGEQADDANLDYIRTLERSLADATEARQSIIERAARDVLAMQAERNDALATLAAVRAWAANPHGAKSELRKILGDES